MVKKLEDFLLVSRDIVSFALKTTVKWSKTDHKRKENVNS